jgi:hypothetical protein
MPGGEANAAQNRGLFSATYLRTPDRDRVSVHHVGIVYEVDGMEGDLRNEEHGSTDWRAWITLDQVDALPLAALAKYGRELVTRLAIRS